MNPQIDQNQQKQEALKLLEIAINKATKKGVYNLSEVYQLINALNIIKQSPETQK
jgi:hypothetical protein